MCSLSFSCNNIFSWGSSRERKKIIFKTRAENASERNTDKKTSETFSALKSNNTTQP